MKRFALHYLEKLGVMPVGMAVLGAFVLAAVALGYAPDALETDAPALMLAGMAASMVAPMVWRIKPRGHSRSARRAIALSIIAPSAAAIALLAGSAADLHVLIVIQHVAMLSAMAFALFVHRSEFMHGKEHR